MCPQAPISPRLDINVSSTDEDVLMFLARRRAGDPLNYNMITEVNPFSVPPWDSPEGMWYLCNVEDGCLSNNHQNTIKLPHVGYWRFMDHLTIYRANVAAGRKITWEFYIGQEPLGIKTSWLMYDYQRVHKACQGISVAQVDCNSMCRVFLQEDQREIISDQKSPDMEHCSPVSSDNDGKHVESMLLHFLGQEETTPPTNVANKSEDCNSKYRVFLQEDQREIIGDQRPPDMEHCSPVSSDNDGKHVESMLLRFLEQEEITPPTNVASQSKLGSPDPRNDGSIQDHLVTSDSAADLNVSVQVSQGEYLELQDLYGLDSISSSSSSVVSSHIFSNSDRCFDSEALLRELENESSSRLSQSAGSIKINTSCPTDDELVLANSSPSDGCLSTSSSPVDKSGQLFTASTSAGHPKRHHSGSSESSSSSNGSGSKSARRIAKLAKKYCCFTPF